MAWAHVPANNSSSSHLQEDSIGASIIRIGFWGLLHAIPMTRNPKE